MQQHLHNPATTHTDVSRMLLDNCFTLCTKNLNKQTPLMATITTNNTKKQIVNATKTPRRFRCTTGTTTTLPGAFFLASGVYMTKYYHSTLLQCVALH